MEKKHITKEKALERLASLCSRAEQCEFDLIKKLTGWGLSSSEKKEIIDYLKENRYVDNARYAASFANDKARFLSWGPYKIRVELLKRRIPAPLVKEVVNSVDSEYWKEGLLKKAVAKSKNLDLTGENGYENRQKLFRYLISIGFPSASASKAVTLMKRRQED